jgi:hypothetical protein
VNGHFLRGVISVVGKRNVRMHIGSHAEKTLCSIRRFRLNSSMPRSVGNHTKAACFVGAEAPSMGGLGRRRRRQSLQRRAKRGARTAVSETSRAGRRCVATPAEG